MKKIKNYIIIILLLSVVIISYLLIKRTFSLDNSSDIIFDYTVDVDYDEKIIKNVVGGTSVDELLSMVSYINDVEEKKFVVYDKDNNVKLGSDVVATGDNLFLKYVSGDIISKYTISVLGDVDGDGFVNLNDVSVLFKYYRGEIKNLDVCNIKAGDVKFIDSNNLISSNVISINVGDSYKVDDKDYLVFSNNNSRITLSDVAKLYQYVNNKIDLNYYNNLEYTFSDEDVVWSSNDLNIVKIEDDKIFGVSDGITTVKAKLSNGKNIIYKVIVKNSNVLPSEISLNKTSLSMKIGDSETLIASMLPTTVTDNNIVWESSNSEIVAVSSNGKITANGFGTATVTAATVNGKVASCNISVVGGDRIHFISNGDAFSKFLDSSSISGNKGPSPSETILLESNGKFALIDAGLVNTNSENPNRAQYVLEYMNKLGVKELEYVIMTHAHYDHMGGAQYIISNMPTKKLYTKVYYANDNATQSSKQNTINRYNNLYNTANELGIFEKINANYDGTVLYLGNMEITLYAARNLLYYSDCYNQDENVNSLITYIVVNGKKVLFTGDLEPTSSTCLKKFDSSCSGTSVTQCVVATNNIKNIDLLKLPHHGYSSCDINKTILSSLNPKLLVVGNWEDKVKHYYTGINGNKAYYSGYESCMDNYFSSYYTSGSNKNAYYVNNDNVIFDFFNNDIKVYNN